MRMDYVLLLKICFQQFHFTKYTDGTEKNQGQFKWGLKGSVFQ